MQDSSQNIDADGVLGPLRAALERMDRDHMRRRPHVLDSPAGPHVVIGGRRLVCLCANDYLHLAADPALRRAAAEAVEAWGVGAGASRLVSGTLRPHADLEADLAAFKHTGQAVVTSTGWMANRVAVHALAGDGDLVLCDKLDHASIIDAARSCGARMRTFAHRDTARLEALLRRHRHRFKRCLIVTDSLFSMDGDLAPLAEIARLKRRYDAALLIDEAHATGVLGEGGRGAAELLGVEQDVDLTVGTLSKALGTMGGFVAGPGPVIEYIRSTARAYIYTTAPPAAICAAARAALRIVRDEPARRQRLQDLASSLRETLAGAGLETGDSRSQILPVIVGAPEKALAVSRRLREAGFLVPAIRPPTVPPGTSRLRVSLSSGHDKGDLDRFVAALSEALSAEGG